MNSSYKNELKLQKYKIKSVQFLQNYGLLKYLQCKFIVSHKMAILIYLFAYRYQQRCPKQ